MCWNIINGIIFYQLFFHRNTFNKQNCLQIKENKFVYTINSTKKLFYSMAILYYTIVWCTIYENKYNYVEYIQ